MHSNVVFTTIRMREGSMLQIKVIKCNEVTDPHRRRWSDLTVLHRQNITTW